MSTKASQIATRHDVRVQEDVVAQITINVIRIRHELDGLCEERVEIDCKTPYADFMDTRMLLKYLAGAIAILVTDQEPAGTKTTGTRAVDRGFER